MSKTLESRDALFCLCCCTAFGGGNRPGARREARLLRRVEAISHCYEQQPAEGKHDLRVLVLSIESTLGLSPSKLPSLYGVCSLLAIPLRGQYESVFTVHEAAFAVYGFLEKPRLKYVSRARSRAGFNMHPEGASNCSWGKHRALLRSTSQGSAITRESMLASV